MGHKNMVRSDACLERRGAEGHAEFPEAGRMLYSDPSLGIFLSVEEKYV